LKTKYLLLKLTIITIIIILPIIVILFHLKHQCDYKPTSENRENVHVIKLLKH